MPWQWIVRLCWQGLIAARVLRAFWMLPGRKAISSTLEGAACVWGKQLRSRGTSLTPGCSSLSQTEAGLGMLMVVHSARSSFQILRSDQPTLCASYSEQHLLDPQHLSRTGLFAVLQLLPAGYAFLEPARFLALLGAVTDQVLPSKLPEAFRIVGNAIAVPHSLLTVLVGLQSLLSARVDIYAQIQACWKCKISAANAIVFKSLSGRLVGARCSSQQLPSTYAAQDRHSC